MKTHFPFNEEKARALVKVLFSFRKNRWCDFRRMLLVAYCIEREFIKEHNCPLIGGRHISYFQGIYNVDFFEKVIKDRNFIEFFKQDTPNFDVINMARLKEFDKVSFDDFSDFERGIICQDKYKNTMDNDLNDSDIQAIHFKYEEWLNSKVSQEISIFEIINPDFKEEAIAYLNDFEAFGLYDETSSSLS